MSSSVINIHENNLFILAELPNYSIFLLSILTDLNILIGVSSGISKPSAYALNFLSSHPI